MRSGPPTPRPGLPWWGSARCWNTTGVGMIAVVRLRLHRRCPITPVSTSTSRFRSGRGGGVACRRRCRRTRTGISGHPRPLGAWRDGQHHDRRRDPARGSVAAAQPARRTARVDRDGGDVLMVAGSTGSVPAAHADHGPGAVRGEPPACTCSSAPAIPVSSHDLPTLWETPATRGCRCSGVGVSGGPAVAVDSPPTCSRWVACTSVERPNLPRSGPLRWRLG